MFARNSIRVLSKFSMAFITSHRIDDWCVFCCGEQGQLLPASTEEYFRKLWWTRKSGWRRQRLRIKLCVRRVDGCSITVFPGMNLHREGSSLKFWREGKHSILQRTCWAQEVNNLTAFWKHWMRPDWLVPPSTFQQGQQRDSLSTISLPRGSRGQLICLEEAQTTQAACKKLPPICWVLWKLYIVQCDLVFHEQLSLLWGHAWWCNFVRTFLLL